jgi:hypothetical protein
MSNAYLIVTSSNGNFFTNSAIGDVLMYTQSNSQKLLLGVNTSSQASLTFTSNVSYFSSGNVGIGTTAPAYPLDVTGASRLGNLISSNYTTVNTAIVHSSLAASTLTSFALFQGSTGDTVINSALNKNLAFKINNTEYMTLNSNGNVGIGLVGPTTNFEVAGQAKFTFNGNRGITLCNTNVGAGASEISFDRTANASTQVAAIGMAEANRTFFIWVNGADRLNINTAGNVGIGTTAPAYPLDVNGTVRLNSANNLNSKLLVLWDPASADPVATACNFYGFGISNSVLRYHTDSNGNHVFFTHINERMRINNTGNVGIGTTAPGSRLAVAGGQSVGAAYSNVAAPTNGMIIQGNVGIGTSNPINTLQVTNNVIGGIGPRLLLENLAGGANAACAIDLITYPTSGVQGSNNVRIEARDDGTGSSHLIFHTKTPGGITNGLVERMRITSAGNVSIGTTTPVYALDVNNGIRLNNTSNIHNKLLVLWDDNPADAVATACNFSGFGINPNILRYQVPSVNSHVFYTGNNERMRINSAGNVGIGTNNPGSMLAVAGGATIGTSYSNTAAPTNGMIIQGNVGIGTNSSTAPLSVIGTGVGVGTTPIAQFLNSTGTPVVLFGSTATNNIFINYFSNVNYGQIGIYGGTTALNITSSNVGIGTSNPASRLDVAGQLTLNNDNGWTTGGIRFRSTNGTQDAGLIQGNNGYMYFRSPALDGAGGYQWFNGGASTALMTLSNNGNLGIGTTTPSVALQIRANSAMGEFGPGGFAGDGTTAAQAQLVIQSANNTNRRLAFLVDSNVSIAYIQALLNGTGGIPLILNNAGGNVGIGTSNPGSRLAVAGGATIGTSYSNTAAPTNGMIIQGNVGIGTTGPIYPLDVNGSIRLNNANNLNSKLLVLWDPTPADPVATATNFFGFGISNNILRYHTATGGNHVFYTGATESMRITSTGITGSNGILQVGNVTTMYGQGVSAGNYFRLGQVSIWSSNRFFNTIVDISGSVGNMNWLSGITNTNYYGFSFKSMINNGNTNFFGGPSNVGYNSYINGNTLNSQLFLVNGTDLWFYTDPNIGFIQLNFQIIGSFTPNYTWISSASTTAPNYTWISSIFSSNVHCITTDGYVGIGTNIPINTLQVTNNVPNGIGPRLLLENTGGFAGSACVIDFITYPTSGVQGSNNVRIETRDAGNFSSDLIFHTKAPGGNTNGLVERMRITSAGNVGIGNNNPGSTLTINGSLAKSSGTFDIDHPINPQKRLVHSFIEGPRCDLIYRGTAALSNGLANVNLDTDCVSKPECAMETGTFEALCENPVKYLHNNDSFDKVIGSISGNLLNIRCENSNSTDTIDWMIIAERKDLFIKQWERTNPDGYLITEYTQSNNI